MGKSKLSFETPEEHYDYAISQLNTGYYEEAREQFNHILAAHPGADYAFYGLAVLEAMACGAPVLTTHRTSLPEVGGDAVAYTEPDADSIRDALGALLGDPARRDVLGAAGEARAQEFTWSASAEAHLVSYQRAAEQRAE